MSEDNVGEVTADMMKQMTADAGDTEQDRPTLELQGVIDKFSLGPINPVFSGSLIIDDSIEVARLHGSELVYSPGARWSQARINDWQHRIFNLKTADPVAIYEKLDDEHREMFKELSKYLNHDSAEQLEKLAMEIADNIVVLYHLCGVLGIDIHPRIDAKMDINERRKWNVTEGGSGQHVEGT